MANVTVTIPDELRRQMQEHDEVNWSAVLRRAVGDHLRKLALADAIAARSKLTAADIEELDASIKARIAKAHESA
jgi:sirohydrochlorin ferrochelatase